MTQHRNGETASMRTQRWAGCPDVLEVDLPDQDVGVRTTDWLQGPPTADRRGATTGDDAPDVLGLTATRAVQLLDASLAHVHTAMEAARSSDAQDQLDRVAADVARARDTLVGLTGSDSVTTP